MRRSLDTWANRRASRAGSDRRRHRRGNTQILREIIALQAEKGAKIPLYFPPFFAITAAGGWRGRIWCQPGQVRKEAAVTFSIRVVSNLPPYRTSLGLQIKKVISRSVSTFRPSIEPVAEAPPAYRVLARKYRPATFDQLIGQEAMVRTLSNAIETGRLPHAWMLTGVRGIGKTTTARIIARALNCTGPDGKGGPTIHPCGAMRCLPRDRRRPPCRCAGNGRGVAHRRR